MPGEDHADPAPQTLFGHTLSCLSVRTSGRSFKTKNVDTGGPSYHPDFHTFQVRADMGHTLVRFGAQCLKYPSIRLFNTGHLDEVMIFISSPHKINDVGELVFQNVLGFF